MSRQSGVYKCLGCGKEFRRPSHSDGQYCSMQCRGDVVSLRSTIYKRVELAAKDGSMTPDEIVATLRAVPREPIRVLADEEGEDG